MPNKPHDNANEEKMDDDDLFNVDVSEPKMKQEMNTDYYHDVGALELMPVTPADGSMFTEQGLRRPSDFEEVTPQDTQETFERTTIHDIGLDYRKWEVVSATEGEGLRYPTYRY